MVKHRRLASSLVLVGLGAIAGSARAQERSEPAPPANGAAAAMGGTAAPPNAEPERRPAEREASVREGGGARTHDGFYLRMGAGYGYMTTAVDPGAGSVKGAGSAWLLSIGGTVSPGLVIAGTMFLHLQSSPTIETAGFSAKSDKTLAAFDLGPTVDYYLNPREGLHLGGSLFYSTFNGVNYTSTGFGAALHGGYDFWVSDGWSIGPVLQLAYSKTSKDPEKDSTTSVALMVEFVDH